MPLPHNCNRGCNRRKPEQDRFFIFHRAIKQRVVRWVQKVRLVPSASAMAPDKNSLRVRSMLRRLTWEHRFRPIGVIVAMRVHLIDGTYELFRHYYALPKVRDSTGQEVAAVRGVTASLIGMLGSGATHIAVATDHVIESFRNDLWPGYKTGEGIEP